MTLTFASRKIKGQFEAALIVDNRFQGVGKGQSALELLTQLLAPYLDIEQKDGADLAVNLTIRTADEVEDDHARDARAKQIAEAKAANEQLTALVEGQKKTLELQAALKKGETGAQS